MALATMALAVVVCTLNAGESGSAAVRLAKQRGGGR